MFDWLLVGWLVRLFVGYGLFCFNFCCCCCLFGLGFVVLCEEVVCSFVCLFVCSFVCMFVRSLDRSFVC